jgi:hypothetical protein
LDASAGEIGRKGGRRRREEAKGVVDVLCSFFQTARFDVDDPKGL